MQVISAFIAELLCDAVRPLTKSLETRENVTIGVMVLDLHGQILTHLLMEFILSTS